VSGGIDVGAITRTILLVLVVLVAWWVLLTWAVVRRPILAIPAVIFTALVVLVGMHDAQALMIYALIGLWIWRRAHRDSFDRLIGARARSGWRRWRVYERHWRTTMLHSGLSKHRGARRDAVARIERVISNQWCDKVRIRLVRGQCTEDFEKAAPGLAHAFGAQACRVREDRPGRLWLHFQHADPLVEPVPVLPVPDKVDLKAVPVGVTEDGDPWRVRLAGTHVLVAGATGSGKGSVLQSLIRALGPQIRDGLVQLWVIDPKRMELGPGRALYARFAAPTFDENPYEEIAQLLDDAVEVLRRRTLGFEEAFVREHVPTVEEPLIVIFIDELADLTKYVSDRKTKERIRRALGLLQTQGRAPGLTVVAALQDPRKEVCPDRDLFSTRIALRLDEDEQVDMVLGDGARDRGALCDHIDESQPGVAYVRIAGVREPIRVRAAYPTNTDITQLVADYAPRHLDGEQLFQAAEADVDAEVIDITGGRDGEPQDEGDGRREAS
jgi:DNA segregation ATPase FtsK/SpoIIIE, S-DNA-T family